MPIYLFYGDESYLLNREVKQLRNQVVSPTLVALSHKVLKNPTIGDVLEAVGTVSFALGGDTLIEVRDFTFLQKAASSGADKQMLEELKALLTTIEPTKHLLFVNAKVDRKVAFAKWLTSQKDLSLRECKKLEFWKTD